MLWFGLQKINGTIFPSSKPRNMLDDILFVVFSSLIKFFVIFSFILTCKYINHDYPVPVYTLNTLTTPYYFFLTAENVPLTFLVVLWLSKHQPYLCSNFEISKYVQTYLVCGLLVWFWKDYFLCFLVISAFSLVCLLVNTLFLLFSGILRFNCIKRILPFAVYTLNRRSTLCCLFISSEKVPSLFDGMIVTSKYRPYHFSTFETSKYVRRSLVSCSFPFEYVISAVLWHFNL